MFDNVHYTWYKVMMKGIAEVSLIGWEISWMDLGDSVVKVMGYRRLHKLKRIMKYSFRSTVEFNCQDIADVPYYK